MTVFAEVSWLQRFTFKATFEFCNYPTSFFFCVCLIFISVNELLANFLSASQELEYDKKIRPWSKRKKKKKSGPKAEGRNNPFPPKTLQP